MNLKITYATKERKYLTENTYWHVSKTVELSPVNILRSPCGHRGAAAKRYYYSALFDAPADAEFGSTGLIKVNIDRKSNPRFDPKKLDWNGGDVCIPPSTP